MSVCACVAAPDNSKATAVMAVEIRRPFLNTIFPALVPASDDAQPPAYYRLSSPQASLFAHFTTTRAVSGGGTFVDPALIGARI